MIIRSICIWFVLFFALVFLMNPVTSREREHEKKLIELDEGIARVQVAYEQEKNQKGELLKQRQELSKKIELETARGQSAKHQLERN